ncbi:YiiX/YebB-like N1pC/P60 family cysteine hydrolase [Riemerella columbipharyngis]|uniref:Permuted papain-like amidase enzyme, YaeF/YiiX, C92 family n=1 Tax=Riemerella columbipharyngis TaxID=1071918 RepID=A0A1G6YQB0_9FLAO|nr:YiiX/YebB-like N1pC/P60 family cysteine hydrolase [Riemerella columbipharyngis]SDD92501.1 Permuted papain-like amidase enzyme, YaeF/YiiX, C92 family [Riemerella columbipharyngis]
MKILKGIKRILIIPIVLGIFIFILWKGFFWFDKNQEEKYVKSEKHICRLSSKDISKLKDGDVILRRGYGYISNIIAQNLNNGSYDVTHSGILYRKQNQWYVIHSLSSDVSPIDGVQEQLLSDFLEYSQPDKILVVSAPNITNTQRSQIVERAKYYLRKKIPFDHSGKYDDASQLYCTELVWQIFDNDLHIAKTPKENSERKKIFYSMKGLYDPKYFEIVVDKYHK